MGGVIVEIRDVLQRAYEYGIQYVDKGVVANYIPELAKEDKTKAGAALIDKNGSLYDVGTSQHKFSIQSIVKIIIYLCVLEHYDFDYIQKFIGVKPSAKPFNSIIALELSEKNIPVNPFINAGAIVGTSLLYEKYGNNTFEMILNRTRDIIGNDKIDYSRSVFNSESSSAFANRALTYMLLNGKIIPSNVNVDDLLNVYFKSCSILADVRDLAQLGFILSRDGKDGENKQRLSGEHARILRTLMVTCGTYDYSGEFAIKIGLPAKSGVGGGIVTASKAGYGIGVYCPGLDSHGNSYVGTRILEFLSRELNLNIY
jgi:glutaminase A